MEISPTEAEEALAVIQSTERKTRLSIASGGTYVPLIITGTVWLVGFMGTQFLSKETVAYVWAGLSIFGGTLATILGLRVGKRVRSPLTAPVAKRVDLFWLLMVIYGATAIAIARPTDGKQTTMFIILFFVIGQLAMGLLFSFSSVWWALPITALALIGYFLLPDIFLPLDGRPGRRRDDRFWPVHPL
ncbi:MAG: hypothetical protein PVF83_10770 [Anaerolineales bacterium]|jgi:hypothetical protein